MQLREHTGMWNAVRDHVGCLNILVLIREQRQSEGRFRGFASIYLILVPGRKCIEKYRNSENFHSSF